MRRSARIANSIKHDSSLTESESDSPRTARARTPRSRRSASPRKKETILRGSDITSAAPSQPTSDETSAAKVTGAECGTVAELHNNAKMNYLSSSSSPLANGDATPSSRDLMHEETESLKRFEEGSQNYHVDGRDIGSGGGGDLNEFKSVASGALQSTLPEWVSLTMMIGLIFGGCCSNVFALEAIVKEAPDAGHLITLAQFLLVSIEGVIAHFDWNSPTLLIPNQIPIRRWLGAIVLFFLVSVMNNWAFDYNISVPIHIILRSGGSITTMLIGACMGKRFSKVQVLSVLILTGGIILSAMSNAKSMGESEQSLPRFITGLSILFVSQVLAALMGVYIENTYAIYGSNWREGLFYTHALSLPLFIPFAQSIKLQFYKLQASEPLPLPTLLPFLPDTLQTIRVPKQLFYLAVNAVTQYICVRGVNFLAGMSTALTVTIVLNIRKLVSLLLSIWLFGNRLGRGVVMGAAVVFMGAFVYGLESQRQGRMRREAATLEQRLQAAMEERKEYTS
ncbi:UDP-N-acetylglucosamine transporter [Drechslerella dactyloides]|uniref:UDP-N-acetylglucosamine transporter n=1 Tax=Drechslerella dactyloides TaxID=74499 RepID=A0AAD6ISF7_DREDA|nr:UDP-N-acetylglucosamine transporter [Drechslerella dactyloides]